MKKYKPVLSLILAVLMLLTACGRNLADPTDSTDPSESEPTGQFSHDDRWIWATEPERWDPDPYTTEIEVSVQYLPAEVDNPDDLPVLKWLCLLNRSDSFVKGFLWNEEAAVEVNQMLADRNMPFRVQFALYVSDYNYATPLDWLARPEIQEDLKSADLILHHFPVDQVKEYMEPLTGYISGGAEPSLKNAVPHEMNWLRTTAEGEIYGVSYKIDYPCSGGWCVDPKLLTDFGLTEADFRKNLWEMDDILAEIYEKNGNKAFFYVGGDGVTATLNHNSGEMVMQYYPSTVSQWMDNIFIGAGSVFAVDFSQEKPTVVNMLDTEISRNIQAALKRYEEAGYLIRGNKKDGFLLAIFQTYAFGSYPNVDGKIAIPATEPTYDASKAIMSGCNSVLAASEHKEEAITLLSLIAEDEAFRSHLMYGEEGRDYTVDADKKYTCVKREDGSRYILNFLSPLGEFSDFIGKEGSSFSDYDIVYEGMTELETYREIWDNVERVIYSVPFDFTGLENEVNEVRIRAKYYYTMSFCTMTEETYNTMIADMNAAGGDKIMAELQKQLDQWVKENPDKVAANRQ